MYLLKYALPYFPRATFKECVSSYIYQLHGRNASRVFYCTGSSANPPTAYTVLVPASAADSSHLSAHCLPCPAAALLGFGQFLAQAQVSPIILFRRYDSNHTSTSTFSLFFLKVCFIHYVYVYMCVCGMHI